MDTSKKKNISILVAYSQNRVIGNQGKIPWNLSSERNRFKQICNGKKIIMGRKSFDEIGHALAYCTIIIVSKSMKKEMVPSGCKLEKSFFNAIEYCQNNTNDDDEILIAGGEEIYRQALPIATTIYATEIDAFFTGDRFFPPLDDSWKKIEETQITNDSLPYKYITYRKIK